jgi:adenosylhomocysteine nucleosidase
MMTLIVVAMKDEVQSWYQGTECSVQINAQTRLLITGIGKVNAAAKLTEAILKYKVSKIINIGVSGGTKPLKLHTIYQVDKAYYHDAHAEAFGYKPYQIPSMPEYYISDELLNTIHQKKVTLNQAHLYTGDEFVTEEKGFFGLIDMEGCALFQVAYLHHIPIVSYKLVSDVIGNTSYHDFDLLKASQTLEHLLKQLEVL